MEDIRESNLLLSIKPYYVYLIIARYIGLSDKDLKTIEVRKRLPSDDWQGEVYIYCTQDTKSFRRIPKKHRPIMQKYIGKVAANFTYTGATKYEWEWHPTGKNRVSDVLSHNVPSQDLLSMCLTKDELDRYAHSEPIYGWHINDVKVLDKPADITCCKKQGFSVTAPSQSWLYFERFEQL